MKTSFSSRIFLTALCFAAIGSYAQENVEARVQRLKQEMVPKFEALRPSEFFFPENFLHIKDYHRDTGFILIGDVFQTGLFKMPEGTLIYGFGPYDHMGLGPSDKVVKVGLETIGGCVSPDGTIVALGVDRYAEIYKNGELLDKTNGVVFNKILNDHLALANVNNKFALYDFIQKKVMVSYAKEKWMGTLSPDRTKMLIDDDTKIYDVMSGKVIYSRKDGIAGLTNTTAIVLEGGVPKLFDLATKKEVQLKNYVRERMGSHPYLVGTVLISNNKDILYVFDLENDRFISDEPVATLSKNMHTESRAWFGKTNDLFVIRQSPSATFRISNDTEYATAFCVNAVTGEVNPYLFDRGRKGAAVIAKQQQEASAETPEVNALLSSFKFFPSSYEFNYGNFEFIDLTNNSVARQYFTYLGNDKLYGIGRFCSSFGTTKVLSLIVKNPGPNEQYNFHILEIGPKGIVRNEIIATTQKVNGAVTELAKVSVAGTGSSFTITVNTESSSGVRTKTYTAPGGCN